MEVIEVGRVIGGREGDGCLRGKKEKGISKIVTITTTIILVFVLILIYLSIKYNGSIGID